LPKGNEVNIPQTRRGYSMVQKFLSSKNLYFKRRLMKFSLTHSKVLNIMLVIKNIDLM